MIDYYALAGFHCDAVEDRSLDDAAEDGEASQPATVLAGRSYAVAPRRPKAKPLEIAAKRRDTPRADAA